MNRREIEAKIVAKCWKDPSFKQKLQNNPQEAFKELGVDYPKGQSFKVLEEGSNSWTFVLPASPANAQELNERELEKLAAAGEIEKCGQHAGGTL